MSPFLAVTATLLLLYGALAALWLGLKTLVVLWIKKDAERLGVSATAWWASAVLLDVVVLVAWLAARPRPPRRAAPVDVVRGGPPANTANGARSSNATASRQAPLAAGPAPTPGGPVAAPPPPEMAATAQAATPRRTRPAGLVQNAKCPSCGNVFPFTRDEGPTRVTCPECGTSGTL